MMPRDIQQLAVTVFSVAMDIAPAWIACTALQSAKTAIATIGDSSVLVGDQKSRLDEFTDDMEGEE